ncbi:glutathione S-transferase family protein [Vibrio maritimus]
MKLYIANQNYSSWSLRAWLIFAQNNINVEVEKLTLFTPEFYQTLAEVTPTAKVPTLVNADITTWDSLAIMEYVNERYLDGRCWPGSITERAKARAVVSEMHSGFMALRNELPMNCRARRKVKLSQAARADIKRIDDLWSEQMSQYPEQWLFGDWSIADAMYAPVALRFRTYGIELSESAKHYQEKVLSSGAILRWLAEASSETDIVMEDEAGEEVCA